MRALTLDEAIATLNEKSFGFRQRIVHEWSGMSMENGAEKVYDDRANLFVALRNTLVQLSPNSECRSEKHIFNYEY